MRLTLRTLLAYLDGILESSDRKLIEEKLEESEFATSLVHRTRDVTRRMRLQSPEVHGIGMHDANLVAEYLDNTLTSEKVQEFEKVCLDSDVHLAEVASCHHVLTMVLGGPAQVEDSTRDMLYGIEQAEVDASSAGHHGAESRRKPEVPEYLRESDNKVSMMTIAATVLICAALTGGVLMLLVPLDVGSWFDGSPDVPAVVAANPDDGDSADEDPNVPATDSSVSDPLLPESGDETTPPLDSPAAASDPVVDTPSSVDSENPAAVDPATPSPDAVAETSLPTETAPIEDTPPDTAPGDVALPADTAAATPVADAASDASPMGDDGGDPPVEIARVDPPSVDDAGDATPAGDTAVDDGAPPEVDPALTEPAQPVAVGRLLSENQVLLYWNSAENQWQRMATRGSLSVGDRLIALPTYRPMISAGRTTIELDGATRLEILASDADGTPHLRVDYGHLVMRTLGEPNTKLRLSFADHGGVVHFGDAEATVGVHVRRFRSPGTNPLEVAAGAAVDLYAASGKVGWEHEGPQQVIQGPRRLVLSPYPHEDAADDANLPKWIAALQVGGLEKRAAPRVEEGLLTDRSAKLSLIELAQNRRAEVRSLAVRCCAHIGYFGPVIAALSDIEQRSAWNVHVAELANAVNSSTDQAELIRNTFLKQRDEKADDLFRMLWGYSNQDLDEQGQARRLVEYLDHDDLDFRVMSFWNLRELTEMGLNYRPELPEARRKTSYHRWRDRLKSGEIVNKNAG